MLRNILYSIFVGAIFFFLAAITISDYNIMWDARIHFLRGQAFANFFLSGSRSYGELPITQDYARYYRDYLSRNFNNPIASEEISGDEAGRRSIYKENIYNFEWFVGQKAVGHPPLSDIGAAISNLLFYEKLGIVRDDHAYGLFSVILASLLIGVFFYWIGSVYGFFPAVIATIALATTPLFWAEAHNNIKDIPQLVFFSLAIFAFWRGIRNQAKKWIFISAIFAGFALGTKFNVLFLSLILGSWFIFYFYKSSEDKRKKYSQWWWVFLTYPIIMFSILFASWPQLWHEPVSNLLSVFGYYKDIGTNIDYTPAFRTLFGFNTYASVWILFTTFPVVIALSVAGIFGSIFNFKKSRDFLPPLFLLWFLVTVLRVSLPGTAIYGGVRQIMEYIPALSFLAGYGAYLLSSLVPQKLKLILYSIIILTFIPLILTLVKFHPAENAYFNSLVGGLQGAKKANITGWGNTDGGIYHKAVVWLNDNAEKDSHVATAFSEPADFYMPELRDDLLADNLFSGYLQKGEYVVGLTHDNGLEHTYRLRYLENYLDPVYEYVVDGVTLVKIWKNENRFLKNEFTGLQNKSLKITPKKIENFLHWKLPNAKIVTGIEVKFANDNNCRDLERGQFQISQDGQNWELLPEGYPGGTISYLDNQPKNNKLIAPIGAEVSEIIFNVEPDDSCIFQVRDSTIHILD